MSNRMLVYASLMVVFLHANPAQSSNYLEIMFDRSDVDGGGFEYSVLFVANKDGAISVSLDTPLGSYPCEPFGSGWVPEQSGSYWNDHYDLSWSTFMDLIGDDWILIWDEGLPTQTVAHIGYGSVDETGFFDLPNIVYPASGSTYLDGVSHVEWNYGATSPCLAQLDEVEICVVDVLLEPICQEATSCDVTRINLDTALSAGEHRIEVRNALDNARATADGIGGAVTGDPWVLDNSSWLALRSIGVTIFSGEIVETDDISFGAVKHMYR